jgi:hypothetical protein
VDVSSILAEIDSQISKLQQARALLSVSDVAPKTGAKRGRPKGSKNTAVKVAAKTSAKVAVPKTTPKRKLSAEGRKRIADAMKKRWADKKKVAAK